MWAKEKKWENFSFILLVKVEVVILKYKIPLHFIKSSVKESKETHTHLLAG
jgi:hypothetical protein